MKVQLLITTTPQGGHPLIMWLGVMSIIWIGHCLKNKNKMVKYCIGGKRIKKRKLQLINNKVINKY